MAEFPAELIRRARAALVASDLTTPITTLQRALRVGYAEARRIYQCLQDDNGIVEMVTGLAEIGLAPEEFFILNTDPNQLWPGLCVWWGPNRRGYVTDLAKAGVYSKEEARDQERSRDSDVAVPVPLAERLTMEVVDVGKLRQAMAEAARSRVPGGGGGRG